MLRPQGEVARAPDRLPCRSVDNREGHVEAGVAPLKGVVEPGVEALPVGGGVDREPAPDRRILRRFPEIVLVLGSQRLDGDEPAFQPRLRRPPRGHYASRM